MKSVMILLSVIKRMSNVWGMILVKKVLKGCYAINVIMNKIIKTLNLSLYVKSVMAN